MSIKMSTFEAAVEGADSGDWVYTNDSTGDVEYTMPAITNGTMFYTWQEAKEALVQWNGEYEGFDKKMDELEKRMLLYHYHYGSQVGVKVEPEPPTPKTRKEKHIDVF